MKSDRPQISIIIPTQRRLVGLETAIRSVFRQIKTDFSVLEMVVVDNDLFPSARDVVERLGGAAPLLVTYVHEPTPGVASARNAAMAVARGAWIAFLDDDEEAGPDWLAPLMAVQAMFEADVVFGPVRGRVPDHLSAHKAYLEWFFSRIGPGEAEVLDRHYGCGNSLIRRSALPHQTAPFSMARNQMGGEDDVLFAEMQAQGVRFAWAPEAWVWEDPPAERLTLSYTLSRSFSFGQGHGAAAWAASDWPALARWMIIGLGQGCVNTALAAALALAGSPQAIFKLDLAIRGFGKTFWWWPFRKGFYGQSV